MTCLFIKANTCIDNANTEWCESVGLSSKMADKSGSTTHEITYYLNVENAKILAFLMVTGFVVYHGFIHIKYSKYRTFMFFLVQFYRRDVEVGGVEKNGFLGILTNYKVHSYLSLLLSCAVESSLYVFSA